MSQNAKSSLVSEETQNLILSGRIDEAIRLVDQHLAQFPDSAHGHFARAMVGHSLGRVDMIVDSMGKAVSNAKNRDEVAHFRNAFEGLSGTPESLERFKARNTPLMHGKLKKIS